MSNNKRFLSLLVLTLGLGVLACDDEDITPTGNLDRPSGLAYVQRDETRGDLYIADAEAQGVRIFQMLSNPLQGSSSLAFDRQTFVRAPAVHFPLVIPAPRFPTQISAQETYVYALSTVSSKIHVLEVGASDFGASATKATGNTFKNVAELSLDRREFAGAIPVTVRAVEETDVNRDLLLLALDRPEQADGLLAAIWVSGSGPSIKIDSVETTTLAGGSPRDLIVRDDTPQTVIVSSAMTSTISLITLDTSASKVFGLSQTIDVGGPTGRLINAEESGVVALRLDQEALVLLELANGLWRRSPRRFDTDRGLAGLSEELINLKYVLPERDWDGRILLPSMPVAGAFGRLAALRPGLFATEPSEQMLAACLGQTEWSPCNYTVSGETELRHGRCRPDSDDLACTSSSHIRNVITRADKGTDGLAPVVYIVLADGRDIFLVGQDLRLAKIDQTHVQLVHRTLDDDLAVSGCEAVKAPVTCEERHALRSAGGSACESTVFSQEYIEARSFRAEFRGNILMAEDGQLQKSVTSTVALVLTKANAGLFYTTRPSDRIRIQLRRPELSSDSPCLTSVPEQVTEEGEVTFNNGESLELVFPEDSAIRKLSTCASNISLDLFEVFPAYDEVVLSQLKIEDEREAALAFDRAAVQTSSVSGLQFVELRGVLNTTLNSVQGFSCTVETKAKLCFSDADCHGGQCATSQTSFTDGYVCAGICKDPCSDGSCAVLTERVCSGATFQVAPAVLNSNSAVTCSADGQKLLPAAPEDVVFIPNRQSWLASFPGSRALRETMLTAANDLTCAWYR